MTDAVHFPKLDLLLAVACGAAIEMISLYLLGTTGGTTLHADISDERSKPMSVAITPMLDEAPLLKLGSKKQPNRLPDKWLAPKPVERAAPAAFPSPTASRAPQSIPTTRVSDAGVRPPSPDAQLAKQTDLTVPTPADTTPAPVSTVEGAADGVKEGTEKDPLKAHVVSVYRAKLDAWFSSRFHIRGKVPFDTLKSLRARVSVNVGEGRTVTGFTVASPSGNDTFDDELRQTLTQIQSSAGELPPPPPDYPDILGQTLSLSFSCTQRNLCD